MFLILSSTDEPLGQYGLRWDGEETVELDGGILGEASGPPRLFFHVQRTLLDWLFITFETRRVTARVLSKNAFAIKLHKSLGLEPIAFEPLALEVWAGGERRYRCVAPGTATDVPFQCITLEITRAAYLRQKAEAGRS
jgi:RimJ/RimL family protein N-acetyltransferase